MTSIRLIATSLPTLSSHLKQSVQHADFNGTISAIASSHASKPVHTSSTTCDIDPTTIGTTAVWNFSHVFLQAAQAQLNTIRAHDITTPLLADDNTEVSKNTITTCRPRCRACAEK